MKNTLREKGVPTRCSSDLETGERISPFLLLPLTIVHAIDNRSPLYQLGAQDLASSRLEIVAVLEGVVENTGMVTQARASYLGEEIVWGEKFHPIQFIRTNNERRMKADLSSFDNTYRVTMPALSAKEYEESKDKGVEYVEFEHSEKDKKEETNGVCECQVWIPTEQAPDLST